MSVSTKQMRDTMRGLHTGDRTDIVSVVYEADPGILKAETNLRCAADMLTESRELNWVSATDQQRLAARLALDTARVLTDLVA